MNDDKQMDKQCHLCEKKYNYREEKIAKESKEKTINYVNSHADRFLKKIRLKNLHELSEEEQRIVYTLASMGKETLNKYLCNTCGKSIAEELITNAEKIEHLKIRNYHLKKEIVYLALQNYNISFREFLINQELADIKSSAQIDPSLQLEELKVLKEYLKKFHHQLEELDNFRNDLQVIDNKIPELEYLAQEWIEGDKQKSCIFLQPKLKSDIKTWNAVGNSLMDFYVYAWWSLEKNKTLQVSLESDKFSKLSLMKFDPK